MHHKSTDILFKDDDFFQKNVSLSVLHCLAFLLNNELSSYNKIFVDFFQTSPIFARYMLFVKQVLKFLNSGKGSCIILNNSCLKCCSN